MAISSVYTTEKLLNPSILMIYNAAEQRFEAWQGNATGTASSLTSTVAFDVAALTSTASGNFLPLRSNMADGSLLVTQANTTYAYDSQSSYVSNVNPTTGDSSMSYFQATGLTNSAQTIKSSVGNLYGWSVVNNNAAISYVKLYQVPAGSVNTGTSVPIRKLAVAANSTLDIPVNGCSQRFFTGLSVLGTSTYADLTSQAAPSTQLYFECQYK